MSRVLADSARSRVSVEKDRGVAEAERMVREKKFCPYPPGFLSVVYSLRHGEGFVDE